ncbi:MAG: adenylate/guanylate cyclase domain-containing protein [Nitrososphaerota archaeon]|jgi:class 3 adenylate cyclase|nr:adenylate/guanylate cyclase domain-containing protein [Nitrososphaerota archaeon]MDG6956105.1 adenylate/guanylate cyclase domain-containing protein [Nitrososphaerota archaeon]MDG6958493.1 adenylate/guanylate cyclase domain-containing protein [Nitrososphaerota archaeon]MDG6960160.1 adenylate/guanylate cyclase domain-containing protein [Nitrososphaerota archaeon]MDG6965910.1 adenylate/guanylate cyclase domain-containing protein [Nitrososphaerota archaeon]
MKSDLKGEEALKKLDMHAPPDWKDTISKGELIRLLGAGDQTGIHVVIGDVRGSTHLMREAISSREYAIITTSFTERMKKIARENSGWFDKFTGDGFIVYWLYGSKPSRFLGEVMDFCRRAHEAFTGEIFPEHKKNARNLPAHVGLALGVDSGRCALEEIAGDFTIIGHAVVGAKRMAEAAAKGETLCNIRMGHVLRGERSLHDAIELQETVAKTKEYPVHGQEAYRISFRL